MPMDGRFKVENFKDIQNPDIVAWKEYVNQKWLYVCESHKEKLETLTLAEAEKMAIKEPNPMTLKEWLKDD